MSSLDEYLKKQVRQSIKKMISKIAAFHKVLYF